MASRRIEDLYPPTQPIFRKLLEEAQKLLPGWTAFITDGARTMEDQAQLYANGRGSFTYNGKKYIAKSNSIVTNAKPGFSFHNYGLAVDIGWQKDGKLSYAALDKLGPIARSLGFTWGADFGDRPHFEYSGGLTITQVKNGARPKVDSPTPPVQNNDMKFPLYRQKGQPGIYYLNNKNELIGLSSIPELEKWFGVNAPVNEVDDLNTVGQIVNRFDLVKQKNTATIYFRTWNIFTGKNDLLIPIPNIPSLEQYFGRGTTSQEFDDIHQAGIPVSEYNKDGNTDPKLLALGQAIKEFVK